MTEILTTHVGSLIRPQSLMKAREGRKDGSVDDAAYAEELEKSVVEVVRHQHDIGLDIVNDGEFGKTGWFRYFFDRVAGVETRPAPPDRPVRLPASRDRERFLPIYEAIEKAAVSAAMQTEWVVTGPLEYSGHAELQGDLEDLGAALDKAGHPRSQAFLPLVAPSSVESYLINEYYDSAEDMAWAIADVLRVEFQAVIDAGFVLQVDDAFLANNYDAMLASGRTDSEYREWADVRIAAANRALAGLPQDRVRYHVCWGSWPGPHMGDVPLRDIVDLVLRVDAGGYLLEMANPRHEHEWTVWEEVGLPEGKVLFPGVVTHSTPVVEHPELVAQRLTRLAGVVGAENVVASTDCGFAQSAGTERVQEEIQWAKLEALVEGTRLASKKLS